MPGEGLPNEGVGRYTAESGKPEKPEKPVSKPMFLKAAQERLTASYWVERAVILEIFAMEK